MEVNLLPPLNGCLMALVTLWTLGLYPLLRRMGERHFIRRMDDAGMTTRAGRLIPWAAVTAVNQVESRLKGVKLSNELLVASAKGKASLPLWRTKNPDELEGYMLKRLPPGMEVTRGDRVSYR